MYLLVSSKDESIKFIAKKQRSDWKNWGSGWRDGRYFYQVGSPRFGLFSSVLPPQGLFQPIYTVLLWFIVISMDRKVQFRFHFISRDLRLAARSRSARG
jgi:hypothetical protein